MWYVFDKYGNLEHKTDSFSMAANLAGYIRGSYQWKSK